MGIIQKIKRLLQPADSSKDWFYAFGNSPLRWHNERELFCKASVLSSVISKRAECFGNARVYVVDSDSNEPDSKEAVRLRSLLLRPNRYMSWSEFYRAVETYRLLYGYCPVLKMSAFEGDIPAALYIVEPRQLDIAFVNGSDRSLIGRAEVESIRIGGRLTDLRYEDFIIFNDQKVGFGVNPLFAASRMEALLPENRLSQVISDAELSIIRNRGALGILTKDARDESGSVGNYNDDIRAIQEQYRRYGISSDQWNLIITSTALRWQSITQPLKDLMLPEFEEQTAKKICGVYNLPYELLPLSGQSTYANRREALVELYQNYVIPSSSSDAEILTNALCVSGLRIDLDYSDMPVLQEYMQAKAATVLTAMQGLNAAKSEGNITLAEWRKIASEYIAINPDELQGVEDEHVPLVQTLGVGGLTALTAILADTNLTDDQKRGILLGVFEIPDDRVLEIIPIKPLTGNE